MYGQPIAGALVMWGAMGGLPGGGISLWSCGTEQGFPGEGQGGQSHREQRLGLQAKTDHVLSTNTPAAWGGASPQPPRDPQDPSVCSPGRWPCSLTFQMETLTLENQWQEMVREACHL